MDDSIFAEIDIETTKDHIAATEAAVRFFASVSPPEPIKPRNVDPVRERFYEMRKLASKKPFPRNDSELFFRQARFMEDYTDDYTGDAKFNMYYPYYQNMGYEYLRTYFSWRTKIRSGDIQQTSLSYVFLYIYELLSGIGISGPEDGLEKLLVVWNTFAQGNPPIKNLLPKWLKDYHVFYELPNGFSEFVEEHEMQKFYSLTLLFNEKTESRLELWNGISSYNVKLSRFYKGNEQLLNDCFNAVYEKIQDFCAQRNTRFEDLLVYSSGKRSPWQPFKHALFGSRAQQTDREIKFSDFERYYCKNGQWTANLPIYYSSQKDFVGYVLKKTEACLRQAVNFKYKLTVDMKPGSKPFRELQRPAAKRAELDKVIEAAVSEFHKSLTRTIVTVDHTNLSRIREEALETQEQLIVPEEIKQGDGSSAWFSAKQSADSSSFENQAEEPSPCLISPYSADETPITLSFADGWKVLKNALTDIERKALSLILHEGDIKSFADENNIMLEVLADNINEKASDSIGDNLLETDEDIFIYDEYSDNVKSII